MELQPVASDAPFVGRDRELAALGAGLRDARSGRAQMLAVVGEAGIGKTRTVEEFVRRTQLPSGRVLWGRCPEQPGAPTYWPWVRAIRNYVDTHDPTTVRAHLGDAAPAIAQIVPALRERLALPEQRTPVEQDPQARFELFDGIASFLQRAAADEPLVVVIEDVHWADEASLVLLAFVARETRPGQLLLIVTQREREPRRWPRAFAELARLGRRILLRGLDRAALEALIGRAVGTTPDPALVARLSDVTEGNPFFLAEIMHTLRAGGTSIPPDAVRLMLPDSVRDAILRRLDPLSPDERSLLATAAVIGREFDATLLQAASTVPMPTVLAQLTTAAAEGVVEEHARAGTFRFSHALVREMLYADLLPAARVDLHRRVAEALEATHGAGDDAPLDALAFHYFHAAPAGSAGRAFDFSMRAAKQAARLLAHGDAMAHYERALGALSLQGADDRRRFGVCMQLGNAAWRAGHNPKAREHYRAAARAARTLGDHDGLFAAAIAHGRASPPSGAPDPASVALVEEALAHVGDADGPQRAILLAVLGRALYFSPELARCRAITAEAVEIARRVGDPGALTVALLCRQLALLGSPDVAERAALAEESYRLAAAGDTQLGVHESLLTRILCLVERGEIAAATVQVEQMHAAAERDRLPERQWHATVQRASLAILAGRFDEASSLAAQALAVRRDASDPAVSHVFLVQAYLCRSETGHVEGLEESIRSLVRDYPAVPAWRCILGLLLAETGRVEQARVLLDELATGDFAAIRRDFLFPAALAWTARLVALLDDAPRARTLHRLLTPYQEQNIVVSLYSPGCLGATETYLGLLAATFGDVAAAVRHFEAGLAMNTRMGARPLAAHTQQAFAAVLRRRDAAGDRARANALLAAARETADACGMAGFEPAPADDVAVVPTPARPPAGAGMEATLRREADGWSVRFGADTFQLKDTKGLAFLHALLTHPGQDVHVLDLVADAPAPRAPAAGDVGLLDPSARAAYKERLDDLRDELDEAERFNDQERASRAQREIEFLTDELAKAVGLGGRDGRAAAAAERARVNVTRTIAAVMKKILAASPGLGEHLAASIKTGYLCSYAPDPRMPIRWSL